MKTGSDHLVLQTLYRIFRDHQLLESLPSAVAEELLHIYSLNKERNLRIVAQAQNIIEILNENRISAVCLKGLAFLLDNRYVDPGDRLMADIDLLVPKESIQNAISLLSRHGYTVPLHYSKVVAHIYKKHHPRIYREGDPAYVEVHWDAVKSPHNARLSSDHIFQNSRGSRVDKSILVPDTSECALHCFIHSQFEHHGHFLARVSLRSLYDMMRLSMNCDILKVLSEHPSYRRRGKAFIRLLQRDFGFTTDNENFRKVSGRLYAIRNAAAITGFSFSFALSLALTFHRRFILGLWLILTRKSVRNYYLLKLKNSS